MPLRKLYSERLREAKGSPDIFKYDTLPMAFRNQVVHILTDAIGPYRTQGAPFDSGPAGELLWTALSRRIAKSNGLMHLPKIPGEDDYQTFLRFFVAAPTLAALDMIELASMNIDTLLRIPRYDMVYRLTPPDEAIEDLNDHFRLHGIGYEFRGGQILRIDSQLLHSEAVVPALTLLHARGFEGPEKEFLAAFELHRHGQSDAAITETGKAFESTLKAIFDERKWSYSPTANAKDLLKVAFENELVPPWLQSEMGGLRAVIEAVPTVRNKLGGHGDGAVPIRVPDHFVEFVLHSAAANIVLFVRAHRESK